MIRRLSIPWPICSRTSAWMRSAEALSWGSSTRRPRFISRMSYQAGITMPPLMVTGSRGAWGRMKRTLASAGSESAGTRGSKSLPSAPRPCRMNTQASAGLPPFGSMISSPGWLMGLSLAGKRHHPSAKRTPPPRLLHECRPRKRARTWRALSYSRRSHISVSWRLADDLDVGSLEAFLALGDVEGDLLAVLQGLEAVSLDLGKMSEQVVTVVVRRNEAEALGVVEPLDSTGSHYRIPLIAIDFPGNTRVAVGRTRNLSPGNRCHEPSMTTCDVRLANQLRTACALLGRRSNTICLR